MKKTPKIMLIAVFATLLVLNFSFSDKENSKPDFILENLIQKANATCEVSLPGYPDTPCNRIYCDDIMMFKGCGIGTGSTCSTSASCP